MQLLQDKGTEVPSLSQAKGTMGKAQNLVIGWDGPGQSVKDRMRDWIIAIARNTNKTKPQLEKMKLLNLELPYCELSFCYRDHFRVSN